MRRLMPFLVILTFLVGCKNELVEKPERLIDKDVMVNIMYDLSILDAIKYQNPASLDTFKINPRGYVYKKYKIDSLQFAKSNIYYAADYEDYKSMFDEVTKRLDDKKKDLEARIKLENKKKKPALKNKNPQVIPGDSTSLQ